MDSVSCSPFRVPLARLGVAQALLACGRVHIDDVQFDFTTTTNTDDDTSAKASTASSAAAPVDVVIDDAIVLHTLRVRGFVTADGFTASLGQFPSEELGRLIEGGHVRHIEKRDMYGLLPSGKELHAALLDTLANDAAQTGLADHYPAFLQLNDDFKQLCTNWQVRDNEPNDHGDADYDQSCVDRLTQLASNAVVVIDGFAAALPRISRYNARLGHAAGRVANGENKQFTGVMCESFHDIWMELHEDLIVLQRVDRAEEGSF